MRKLTRFSVVLSACFAMGFAACDSDDGETTPDTTSDIGTDTPDEDTTGGDTVEDDTTDAMGDEGGTPDVEQDNGPDVVVDPCDPNPCTTPPVAVCTGNTLTTYAAEGTCTATGATASCNYEATDTACSGDTPICFNGECVEDGELPTEFGASASWISSLQIGGIGEVEECCFDFPNSKNAGVDNALGKLVNQLGSFLGDTDVNALLLESIQEGTLTILLEHVGLDETDPLNDTEFVVNGYYGSPASPTADPIADYNANLGGNGDFLVSPSSFAPNGMPLIAFGGASIVGGAMEAGPSPFTLSFPLGDINLTATVSDTQIAGTAAVGPNGTGLTITEGKLGGYIHIQDLVGALNGYASSSCACLGLTGPLVNYTNETTFTCNKSTSNTCTEDEDVCVQLNQYCSIALPVIKSVLDIDSDASTKYDSLSVGVWFEATSANLTGLEAAE